MKITTPIRPSAWSTKLPSATLLLLTPLVCAGSSLWAQTQTPQAQRPAATAPQSGRATTAHELNVDYVGGKLSVTASDASLNEILQEIARKTGMKVTGRVADERVFGHYGPSTQAAVLAELLDGTGSNMLLVSGARGPAELILTPRVGGPTAPNPNPAPPRPAEPEAVPEQTPPPQAGPLRRGIGRPPLRPGAPGTGDAQPGAAPEDTTLNPNPDNSTTPPNGPQQMYNRMRQMQQQQDAQPAPPPQ
ncbi:MAG TPA: hypothetical protein VNW54_02355 [Granulicella sp.]|jgi:hypothetical protein|nr:hypothetical protein [Granulicella sp.]